MDIKSFLIGELEGTQARYSSTKLEADKLEVLQGMSNIVTLLTQIEQLAQLELNNEYTKRQLAAEVKEEE